MEIITNETKNVEELKAKYTGADHISVEGHHIPVADDGVSFLYIDKYGELTITASLELALKSGNGKCAKVDSAEMKFKKGVNNIIIDDVEYLIYGIFEDEKGKGVYRHSGETAKHYLYDAPNVHTSYPNSKFDKETYRKLYEIYVTLM